jgi:hypothetical protein
MKKIVCALLMFVTFSSLGQYTSIPDPNFEQALIDLGYDNVIDGQVLTNNINSITNLNLMGDLALGGNITDLTGIEDFTQLGTLNCSFNPISVLNLSNNDSLTHIICNNCQINQLYVSNPYLLNCRDNQITNIDLTQATRLRYLYCDNNFLGFLNLINSPLLIDLRCEANNLTQIDLTGLSDLTIFYCNDNSLSFISTNSCISLQDFACGANNITQLDLTQNLELNNLECEGNQISELDLSNNYQLYGLTCDNNNLECLNLKNGQNFDFQLIHADNNPNLTCIQVDNVNFSNTAWLPNTNGDFQFDTQTTFSENCSNDCSNSSSISELNSTQSKKIIKIVNLLGQEVSPTPNTIFIKVFSDGTVEKVLQID